MGAVIRSFVAISLVTTQGANGDCSASEDECICVWNLKYSPRRLDQGIYRKIPDPVGFAIGLRRQWINDELTPPLTDKCLTAERYIFYNDPLVPNVAGWFLGLDPAEQNGFCTCNTDSVSDFTQADCPQGSLKCVRDDWTVTDWIVDDEVMIYYGECPTLNSVCTSLRVTADAPMDGCNGVFDAIPPPNNLLSEINIYRNRDTTATGAEYLYYDHTVNRWKCGSYEMCTLAINNGLSFMGDQDDPGTPLWYDDTGNIVIETGDTFLVSYWNNGDALAPAGAATFECNPVTPTVATTAEPTTASNAPTNATPSPTRAPTRTPSKQPTAAPSESPSDVPTSHPPTKAPTDIPTATPSKSPTGTPTLNPLDVGETREPAAPTRTPTAVPTIAPTRSPLLDGETLSPTTVAPTDAPQQLPINDPSSVPIASPTNAPYLPYSRPPTSANVASQRSCFLVGLPILLMFVMF